MAVLRFLRSFAAYAGWSFGLALGLLVLLGLSQGIGLVLLLPLLQLLGIGGSGLGGSGVGAQLAGVATSFGVNLGLPTLLGIYVLVVSAHAGLTYYQQVLGARLTQGYTHFQRSRLQAGISGAEWLFWVRQRAGHLGNALTVQVDRVGTGTTVLLRLLSNLVLALVHVAVALWLSLWLSLLALATATVLLLLLRRFNRRAHHTGRHLYETRNRLHVALTEQLDAMKLVKGMGLEQRQVRGFAQGSEAVQYDLVGFARSIASARLWFQLGAVVMLAVLCYFAVAVMALPPARLLVLVVVFARLLPRLAQLQQGYQQILHMLPAFTTIEQLYSDSVAAAEATTPGAPLPLRREIALHGVSFAYPDTGEHARWALRAVDATIPAHQITVLTGHSGAGKTTLADLILGLLAPDQGEIRVDGSALTPALRYAWRQQAAYVPQDTVLFNASVAENLRWAQPEAEEAALWQALRDAAADDFVRALPQGLGTVVGDRGGYLSGGQRQRLALARALLCEPRLLVMDEATSAVDIESERKIAEALTRLTARLTVVLIAHRSATLSYAAQRIVLEGGRVKDVVAGETCAATGTGIGLT